MLKKGYIGVTSRDWYEYLHTNNISTEVNFWRKNTNNFSSLQMGEPFFFLVKNPRGIPGERKVLGYGVFERFEVLTVDDAWEKYKTHNGVADMTSFLDRMKGLFEIENGTIGCIILSNIHFFDNPVLLSEVGIPFKNSIVSGKGISIAEVEDILKWGNGSLTEVDKLGFTGDDLAFVEGKQKLKQHLMRERDPRVIQLAKERFKQENGRVYCEIYGFDFEEVYGDIGHDFIEGHHIKPVSELSDGGTTKVEDIKLVCSNCHRMLHRKRPWLLAEDLRDLLV